MRTLHQLLRDEGPARVAEAMHASPRALRDLRCGRSALTVDHLHGLARTFADLDLRGTIEAIAVRRLRRQRARWQRRGGG